MWSITGHAKAVELLKRSLERGSLAHAYIFAGPPHIGKMTLALNLAQALNCDSADKPCGTCPQCQKIATENHPDILYVRIEVNEKSADGKLRTEISIDQIRKVVIPFVNLPPFEGKYKMVIVENAELLSLDAANCLLKTLEEPVGKVVFVLLTINDKLLPETVVSRCQRIELAPLPPQELEAALVQRWQVEPQRAKLIARIAHGCPGWAIRVAQDGAILQQRQEKVDRLIEVVAADMEGRFAYAGQLAAQFSQQRAPVLDVMELWRDWWRDVMLMKTGCEDIVTNTDRLGELGQMAQQYTLAQVRGIIRSIQSAAENLKQNVNARLALEVMLLDIPAGSGKGMVKQER